MATGDAKPPSLDDDVDVADLGASLDAPTSKASSNRFRPKPKPKPKPNPRPKPEPEVETKPEPRPKPEAEAEAEAAAPEAGGDAMEVDGVGGDTEMGEGGDGEGEEEDFVVREIDVYFTPDRLDEDTLLYIMQYPLRPCWRPYELDEICEEVRVKPNSSKVEVDLHIDTENDNYDPEAPAPLRLSKQTLSSTKVSDVADYAVGVLRGNLVHLNHIDAVVQLRPSLSHVNVGRPHTRQALQDGEMNGGTSSSTIPGVKGNKRSEDSNECTEDSEPWISLEYHAERSNVSSKYHDKMRSNEGGPIDFTMSTSDYVISLCPGASTGSKDIKMCQVIREMLLLPLEQRLRKWLTEVSEVNRFDALLHLAPTYSEEDVLKVLPVYADLVRGLWVCKSSLLFNDGNACKRDFILLQFTKRESIHKSVLEKLFNSRARDDFRRKILDSLCKRRECLEDYKFISPADSSFIKRFPHIVKEQESAWSARETTILDSLKTPISADPRKIKKSTKSKVSSRSTDPNGSKAKDGPVQGTENHMNSVLDTIFTANKVRSMQAVVRDLRQLAAKYASNRKEGPKLQALSNAARNCASLSQDKLLDLITAVAVPVHGVFVAKPLMKNSLRNVVIKLFLDRAPHGTLTKQEILEKGAEILKREISEKDYHQTVTEICFSTEDGHWKLKNGDEP